MSNLEVEFAQVLPRLPYGEHSLEFLAVNSPPSLAGGRGEGGGEGWTSKGVPVAERLILFRVCPLLVKISQVLWGPARRAPTTGTNNTELRGHRSQAALSTAARQWVRAIPHREKEREGFLVGAAAATIRISLDLKVIVFSSLLWGGVSMPSASRTGAIGCLCHLCASIMLTIVLTQGACLGAVHVGLDDGLEIGAVRAYFGDEMGIAGAGQGRGEEGAVEVDVHLGGAGVTGQGPFTVQVNIDDREHAGGVGGGGGVDVLIWRDGGQHSSSSTADTTLVARSAEHVATGPASAVNGFAHRATLCGDLKKARNEDGSAGRGVRAAAAVIIYHCDPLALYPERWLRQFTSSISNQAFRDFDIWELDYSEEGHTAETEERAGVGDGLSLVCRHHMEVPRQYFFLREPHVSHAGALNRLLDIVQARGYQAVFNTHVDDTYHPERFGLQFQSLAQGQQDLVSSAFQYMHSSHANPGVDVSGTIFSLTSLLQPPGGSNSSPRNVLQDEDQSVQAEIEDAGGETEAWKVETWLRYRVGAGQNVLCNSGIAFGAAFLASGVRFDEPPDEDLRMWLTVFERLRLAVSILPQVLTNYRRHSRQTATLLQETSDAWHRTEMQTREYAAVITQM